MTKQYTCGASSISFQEPVFIQSCASVTGQKEGDGPLGSCFDMICPDPMFGASTWEAAESTMQKEAATLAIGKAGLKPADIRLLFAGDLLAQTAASSVLQVWGFPSTDCSVPALPWEKPSPCPPSALLPDTENISCAQPPATFAVRKKNSVFPWATEIKGPYLLPGQLPVPVPVYLAASLLSLHPENPVLCATATAALPLPA